MTLTHFPVIILLQIEKSLVLYLSSDAIMSIVIKMCASISFHSFL